MLHSYDLAGIKDSFSDLISNISPEDTILVSHSKKSPTNSPVFKWQNDALDSVIYDLSKTHTVEEGADAPATELIGVKATVEKSGNTQIFRKTFTISDSALSSSVHGRKGELELQLMKAGKELKVVMEKAFSSKQAAIKSASGVAPITDGLFTQIADLDVDNPNLPTPTTAGENAVHKKGKVDFDTIDSICNALYRSGSKANVILVNPVNSQAINAAIEEATTKKVNQLELFNEYKLDDKTTRQQMVKSFTDSLGYVWEIKYSRFMPVDIIYFLNTEDLTQRVLREPKASQLGKSGSYETWQLVIECGLSLNNPYSAGCLEIDTITP